MNSVRGIKIVLALVCFLLISGYIIGTVYETYWLGGGIMLSASGVLMLAAALRRRQQRRENLPG